MLDNYRVKGYTKLNVNPIPLSDSRNQLELKSLLVRCRYASHLMLVSLESHVLELEISSPALKLNDRCYSYRPLSLKQHS